MIFEKIELESDETILRIVRRHWFFMFKQSIAIVFFALVPLCAFIGLVSFVPDALNALKAYTPAIVFLYAFWLLINWMVLAAIWTNQYLDIWCVTNRRIIKINQMGLFHRQIASFRLERLQNFDIEIDGIIATFLDFGTIRAQTASADAEEFRETYLPKPQEIKALILKAADDLIGRNPI